MSDRLIIHGARRLDARGEQDDFWLAAADGVIVATGHDGNWRTRTHGARVVDADGRRLVPGFIDLHGHGGGGHSFDDGAEAIRAALAVHRAHGTTRSVLSLVSRPVDSLVASLAAVAELTEEDPTVLGAHLEGPFLAPARRGAHDPAALIAPDPSALARLLDAARGHLVQLTLAPELPNALELIDVLVEAGVLVAVGHTEADAATARAAFDRGARLLTHAFNAMPGIGHRAPGPVLAALEDDRVTLELILDGVHVDPSVAALALREAPGRVALVTDAMAATGVGDGDYRVGDLEVTVSDGVARLTHGDSIAGSTLTQDAALRIALESGIAAPAAVEALTLTPARALGVADRFGLLEPGYQADAVLLGHDGVAQQVWASGLPVG